VRSRISARSSSSSRWTDSDDQVIRRGLRELQEQWKKKFGGIDPALPGIESRFRNAKTAVEAALSARARSREAAVWQTLAAKERLCEELDSLVRSSPGVAEAATPSAAAHERWTVLPPLSPAWERKMIARRDAALRTLSEAPAAGDYLAQIEHGVESRRESLLELELLLGLESPTELQAQRLALQVKQLRERFRVRQRSAPAPRASACSRGAPSRALPTRLIASAVKECFRP